LANATARFAEALDAERARWRDLLDRFSIHVPPEARWIVDTMKSNVGYVLVNMDGPAIQPGSRTYERSWIRDGSLTGTALLAAGHAEAMRDFLSWFAPNQFESGKIPCVVDHRGPDPFDEHDSTGQYIYAVAQLYRFTGDQDVLREHWDHVRRGVSYLESLLAQRTTPEYRGTPYYGILPESASHEGYMSDPMHSYWDDFFCARGLGDAVFIARELGRDEEAREFASLESTFRENLERSLAGAMAMHDIRYLPGCVELGDFDATSTAIGLFPCDVLPMMHREATEYTFDRYWTRFKRRAVNAIEWRDYTPYEVRIIGAFVRLGQPERARALADWFRLDQHPRGWNHWAEVGYRDDRLPGFIGDMPHTWVGSDFVNAARSLFVHEQWRTDGARLILGAGLDPEWLTSEIGVTVDAPTAFGRVTYRFSGDADRLVFELDDPAPSPPGGLRLRAPRASETPRVLVDGREAEVDAMGFVSLEASAPTRVEFVYGR